MMNYTIERNADKLLVMVRGRLDTNTTPDLEDAVLAALNGITEVTFDMAQLMYISSAGLRLMLAIYKRLSKVGGTLRVINAEGAVMSVLDASGFADIFEVERAEL